MIDGFSLRFWGEREQLAGWTDVGWRIAYGIKGPSHLYPAEKAELVMGDISALTSHRSGELTGFTLFHHDGKGWQMSVRRKDEPGWDVKIIPDEQAAAILAMLQASGHPDGSIDVRPDVTEAGAKLVAGLRDATAARGALSAAMRTWIAG